VSTEIVTLTLDEADQIATQAILAGRKHEFQAIAVAVLDVRGCLKVFKADEGTSLLRGEIAIAKAAGALGLGVGGRNLAKRAEQSPTFFQSLNAVSYGRMVPVRGSVLIRKKTGELVGAIGISGDTAENDEVCAIAGIEATGLVADAGE